ncbi:MAG TPA: hypothetical protein VFE56_06910, partial [Candidatus Binataceae bacterium]|nr:hypothetical protein [Candidatus Binataceae bacterium]
MGFAPPGQNLLRPLLRLAPPGQPDRALAVYGKILDLQRKVIVHPALSPELQTLASKLPPQETLVIEAPALYSSADIPWQTRPPNIHYMTVAGHPGGVDYSYSLSGADDPPQAPGQFAATISLWPAYGGGQPPASVIANSNALLYLSGAMLPSQGVAAVADFQREIYGTLRPPWDELPGVLNGHDSAAIDRFARDLPALSGRFQHYLRIHNLVDEFADASGPWVLFNLDAEIRDEALAPFPHLRDFYRAIAVGVEAQSVTSDEQGRQWLRLGFNRGRITLTFMLRGGMPTPMTAQLKPAGAPIDLERAVAGRFHTDSSIAVQRFGVRFGIAGVRFATVYGNHEERIEFDGHMSRVPRLIAPAIVRPLTRLLAGQFMETLARGNDGRGIATSFSATADARGGTMLDATFSGELRDSPALVLVAQLASALTPAHSDEVRAEERRLAGEFFDALAADFNRARPALL